MADKSQQTEKPTQRKLDKARKEAHFPVSKEFVGAVQFLVFVLLLGNYGAGWLSKLTETSRMVIARGFHTELTPQTLRELLYMMTTRLVFPLMMGAAILMGASLGAHLMVTRLGFSFSKLAPDIKRLNPIKNLRNLKSQNPTQFFQALILLPVFSFAVYVVARDNFSGFLQLPFLTVDSGLMRVTTSIGDLLWKGVYVLLAWGSFDLFRQTRKFQQEMRMSKQEIRDESRESDGNPQVKQKIRKIQRDAARQKMMS